VRAVSLIIQDVGPLPVARNMGLLPLDCILIRETGPDDGYILRCRRKSVEDVAAVAFVVRCTPDCEFSYLLQTTEGRINLTSPRCTNRSWQYVEVIPLLR
jgi:hypothetical protein